MSYRVSIDEEYDIRRINDWYINLHNNKIYGRMQLFGFTFEDNVSGNIVGFVDNRVIAKINARLYALVLGNVEKSMRHKKPAFLQYLHEEVPTPQITL